MNLSSSSMPFQLKKLYQAASPIGSTMKTVKSASAGGRKISAVSSPWVSGLRRVTAEAVLIALLCRASERELQERSRRSCAGISIPAALVLVFPGLLDGGRRFVGRHFPGGDGHRDVVDHAPDGGAEILVEEDLMVFGGGEVVRHALRQRVGDRRFSAKDGGNVEALLGGHALVFVLQEKLQELDGFRRRALRHQPAVRS